MNKCVLEKMAKDLTNDVLNVLFVFFVVLIVACVGTLIALPIIGVAQYLGFDFTMSILIGAAGVFAISMGWILYEYFSGRYKAAVEACK